MPSASNHSLGGVMAVRVTIKDVAKHADVAISTASRVINDSGYVSEKTRQRVEQAIRELGYVPNSLPTVSSRSRRSASA